MFSIRKINPMVRAVGTMGAVAALVGGITFANLTSNTVSLAPNQLVTASAALVIDAANTCTANSPTTTPGLSGTLTPGSGSQTVDFCIENTGNVPLTITGNIPQDMNSSNAGVNTTLDISCTKIGDVSTALNGWNTNQVFPGGTLNAGATAKCTATATLASSYGGAGGESIPAFAVNFVGTEPTPSQ